MLDKAKENLKRAAREYAKFFGVGGCALQADSHYAQFYSTGDLNRDAAIIRECIRLNTEIRIPAMDRSVKYADELIKSERTRLHMLVPA